MNPEDAITALHRDGSKAIRSRERSVQAAEREGIQLGAVANLLKANYGQSQTKTASKLGIPQTTLSGWMIKAEEAGHTVEDPIDRPLILDVGGIEKYVADNRINVDRIVTARMADQMLSMTALPIESFSDGRYVSVPLMMARNADNGTWIGVENVLPGEYGGTGPSNVRRAATEFGLDEDLASGIAFVDECSEVDVFGGVITHPYVDTSAFPYPLPDPHPANPSVFVGQFDADALVQWGHVLLDEESNQLTDEMYLRSWLIALTHAEPPSWIRGPLRARIYIDPAAAEADGFVRPGWTGPDNVCQLILERGRTQLWLSLWPLRDPARWVADEAYDLLAAIDHFPKEFEGEQDAASRLRRFIRARTFERVRPPYLDVGPGGAPNPHGLDFVPARSSF